MISPYRKKNFALGLETGVCFEVLRLSVLTLLCEEIFHKRIRKMTREIEMLGVMLRGFFVSFIYVP
jgi:hypothetical protein